MSRAINPATGKKRAWGSMWTKVRKLVIARDAAYHGGCPTCEYCGAQEGEIVRDADGVTVLVAEKVNGVPTGTMIARLVVMQVDHILAFSKGGGEFDLDNLISACEVCNNNWSNHDKPAHIFAAVSALAKSRNRTGSDDEAETDGDAAR